MPGFDNGNVLTEDEIQKLILSQDRFVVPQSKSLYARRAAVLVPLLQDQGSWHILYTRRANTVNTHKGQVSFPGGSVEEDDHSIEYAALREANEEIGLKSDNVRILGQMDEFLTISDFVITPVVGKIIGWPFPIIPMDAEVDRVFTIPLQWLCDPLNWNEKEMDLPDGRKENVIYYHSYDSEILWGVTARITHGFLRRLKLIH